MIDSETKVAQLPQDLTGKSVLDVGAADGWIANWCADHGAHVVAVDVERYDDMRFPVRHLSVYDLDPGELGKFDVVLALGLIYHLRHPLLGLEKMRAVCGGQFIIESQVCDRWFVDPRGERPLQLDEPLRSAPLAQFLPDDRLNADPTNWWSPNTAGLRAMVESCDFIVDGVDTNGRRAWLWAH